MLDWGEGSGWDVFLKKADEELDRQMNSLDGMIVIQKKKRCLRLSSVLLLLLISS
jgi:hypothetical protein